MEKVKFEDLSFETGNLKLEELAALSGGFTTMETLQAIDGCSSGICENGRSVGVPFCDGGAVCTSGIGVCNGKT
jgi:hypothetical protein